MAASWVNSRVPVKHELQDYCRHHLSKALCQERTIHLHHQLSIRIVVSPSSIRVSDVLKLHMLSTTNQWVWLRNSIMGLHSRSTCIIRPWIADTEQHSLTLPIHITQWWTTDRMGSQQWLIEWSNNNKTSRWHLLNMKVPATSSSLTQSWHKHSLTSTIGLPLLLQILIWTTQIWRMIPSMLLVCSWRLQEASKAKVKIHLNSHAVNSSSMCRPSSTKSEADCS